MLGPACRPSALSRMPTEAGKQRAQHAGHSIAHQSSSGSGNVCGPAHLVAAHAKRMQQSRAPAGVPVCARHVTGRLCLYFSATTLKRPSALPILLGLLTWLPLRLAKCILLEAKHRCRCWDLLNGMIIMWHRGCCDKGADFAQGRRNPMQHMLPC